MALTAEGEFEWRQEKQTNCTAAAFRVLKEGYLNVNSNVDTDQLEAEKMGEKRTWLEKVFQSKLEEAMVHTVPDTRQRYQPTVLQAPVQPREHRCPRRGAADGRRLQGLPRPRPPEVKWRVCDRGPSENHALLRRQRGRYGTMAGRVKGHVFDPRGSPHLHHIPLRLSYWGWRQTQEEETAHSQPELTRLTVLQLHMHACSAEPKLFTNILMTRHIRKKELNIKGSDMLCIVLLSIAPLSYSSHANCTR
eukprot:Em0001g502a